MNAAAALARILIVDDEAANMRALCETLRDQVLAKLPKLREVRNAPANPYRLQFPGQMT